jgi:hypothetical protein
MVAGAGLENDIRSTDEAAAKLARPSGEMIFVTAEARYHTCRYCIFAQDSAKEKEDEKEDGKEDGKDGKRKADPRAIRARSLFAKDRFGQVS